MSESDGDGEGARRRGLARGLSALLGDEEPDTRGASRDGGPLTVPIEMLRPSRFQPRRHFDDEQLRGLADSIKEKGILQPLVVRADADASGSYEIVAGERRWRAAQLAQVHEVPVVVHDVTDAEALELALIENIQREDLMPLEEAEGFKRLLGEFKHSQEDVARIVGKSRSHIANTLRLLGLPDAVKALLDAGSLSAGHARALLTAEDPVVFAQEVIDRGLNVRQTEALVRGDAMEEGPEAAEHHESHEPAHLGGIVAGRAEDEGSADTRALERSLTDHLGLKVRIRHRGPGGRLEIHYGNPEQFDDILRRLNPDGV